MPNSRRRVEHIHAGKPGADDDRVVDRELTLVWAFRQGVCVRHECSFVATRGPKFAAGHRRVPSPEQDYRFNGHRQGLAQAQSGEASNAEYGIGAGACRRLNHHLPRRLPRPPSRSGCAFERVARARHSMSRERGPGDARRRRSFFDMRGAGGRSGGLKSKLMCPASIGPDFRNSVPVYCRPRRRQAAQSRQSRGHRQETERLLPIVFRSDLSESGIVT